MAFGVLAGSPKPKSVRFHGRRVTREWSESNTGFFALRGARPEVVCVKVQQKAKGMRFVPGRARSRELESRWGQSELTLLLLGNPSEARRFDLPSPVPTSYD